MTLTTGFCECGCGQRTTISSYTHRRHGYVKGQPRRFVRGHYNRDLGPQYLVNFTTGCWEWQRSLNHEGYGWLGVGSTAEGNRGAALAHRVFYERAKGPIPDGLPLDHLCSNRACVNPDHLEPVTPAENVRRSKAAKLSEADVAEIRRLAALGWTQVRIGERFGVWHTQVGRIIAGKAWA